VKTSRTGRVAIIGTLMIAVIGTGVLPLGPHSIVGANATGVRDRPPSSWLGEWRGTIEQPDSSVHSWTFAMTLKETHGVIVGTYVESSLKCRGDLSSTLVSSSRLEFDETVTAQPPSGTPWFCAGGPIQIVRTGRDSATYSWDGGVAHGVIRR
jgi:hypothetical protein